MAHDQVRYVGGRFSVGGDLRTVVSPRWITRKGKLVVVVVDAFALSVACSKPRAIVVGPKGLFEGMIALRFNVGRL